MYKIATANVKYMNLLRINDRIDAKMKCFDTVNL